MNEPRWGDLRQLLTPRVGPCVSLLLPTHPVGETLQDQLRLKNLLAQAEAALAGHGVRPGDARAWLDPARRLPGDPAAWDKRGVGLALYLASDFAGCFTLAATPAEGVFVNQRFQIRPVIEALARTRRFFVLALGQQAPKLYEGDARDLRLVEAARLPGDLRTALNLEYPNRGEQSHSATSGSFAGGRSKAGMVFHGQGVSHDAAKAELLQYCRLIEAAAAPALRDEHAPLVLAGVEYVVALYREVNRHPHVCEEALSGNFEHAPPRELHARAWELAAPRFDQARLAAEAKIKQWAGTGRTASDPHHLLPAAHGGRVETLFVARDAHQWGRFDEATYQLELADGPAADNADLVDLAAAQTVLHRGQVHVVDQADMPLPGPMAAALRF